jgi:hypothetical protein
MATASNWNEAKAAAMKILGNKAKIPDPKVNLAKITADWQKADKEYDAAVDVLQSKILALQNSMSSTKNALKQYVDLISKNSFGLNEKDDDDKKKIEEAQKVLSEYLDSSMENCDTNIKNLDELDKHTMGLSKYQSQTKC